MHDKAKFIKEPDIMTNTLFSAMDLQLTALRFTHLLGKKAKLRGVKIHQKCWSVDYHFMDAGAVKVAGMKKILPKKANHLYLYPPGSHYREYVFAEDIPLPMSFIVFEGEALPCGSL